jgi:hypothetical protein
LKLADLDLNHLNHHWEVGELSWMSATSFPIKYNIIDWCTDSPNTAISTANNDVYMGTMLPCVYENYLVEKICTEAGYTINNQVLLEPVMLEREPLIPLGTKTYERDFDVSRYLAKFKMSSFNTQFNSGIPLFWSSDAIDSQSQRYWQQFFISNTNYGGAFMVTDEVKLTFTISIDVDNQEASPYDLYLLIYKSDAVVGAGVLDQTVVYSAPVGLSTWTQTFEVDCVFWTGGNGFFRLEAQGEGVGFVTADSGIVEITAAEILNDSYNRTIIYQPPFVATKSYVAVANNLPDVTQADFIREYMKKFASVMTVDEFNKVVHIVPFKKIKDNIGLAVDWSDKIDFSETPKVEFNIGYAQQNILKYKDDDDVVKPLGTDKIIYINDTNLPPEKIVIESKYSATESVERLWGRTIPQIKVFTAELIDKQPKPRCLYQFFEQASQMYYRKNLGNTTDQVLLTGVPFCYFIQDPYDSLGFDNSLYDDFYNYLFGVLESSKQFEVNIRLNASDIATFDFLKPVFIREFDCYFYVSKIKYEYTRNVPATVELIKLL